MNVKYVDIIKSVTTEHVSQLRPNFNIYIIIIDKI